MNKFRLPRKGKKRYKKYWMQSQMNFQPVTFVAIFYNQFVYNHLKI